MQNQLSRAILASKYDPQLCYDQSMELRRGITDEEYETWLNNPCTKALLLAIEGDIAGIFLAWSGGAYTSEDSADATAQMDAKARGMTQALDDIVHHIHHLIEGNFDESMEADYI